MIKLIECDQSFSALSTLFCTRVCVYSVNEPDTMAKVIFTDLIFALGISPRDEARRVQSWNNISSLFLPLHVSFSRSPSDERKNIHKSTLITQSLFYVCYTSH